MTARWRRADIFRSCWQATYFINEKLINGLYALTTDNNLTGKNRMRLSILAALTMTMSTRVFAIDVNTLPQDPKLSHGEASFNKQDNSMSITQNSPKAIVNWDSFSIGEAAKVEISQPSLDSVMLNRVTGGTLSEIAGQLKANGQVILLNPNGIILHENSQIDVGGLMLSTKSLSDNDFINDRYKFSKSVNEGGLKIKSGANIKSHGLAALVGSKIENSGLILAKTKGVAIGSGEDVSIDLYGDDLINLNVTPATQAELINDQAIIEVEQGSVVINASGIETIVDNLVTNSEIKGKKVSVLGKNIDVAASNIVSEGGEINIGGSKEGKGPLPNAKNVKIDSTSKISNNHKEQAGSIVIFADKRAEVDAIIEAKSEEGRGGFVEISGKEEVVISSNPNLSGKIAQGSFFIDPGNVYIINSTGYSVGPNVFSDSWINYQLGLSNLAISTNNATNNNINEILKVKSGSAISWTSNNSLSLIAQNILIDGTITHTSGGGHLNLRADKNDTNSGTISGAGSINFAGNTSYAMIRTFGDAQIPITGVTVKSVSSISTRA